MRLIDNCESKRNAVVEPSHRADIAGCPVMKAVSTLGTVAAFFSELRSAQPAAIPSTARVKLISMGRPLPCRRGLPDTHPAVKEAPRVGTVSHQQAYARSCGSSTRPIRISRNTRPVETCGRNYGHMERLAPRRGVTQSGATPTVTVKVRVGARVPARSGRGQS